MTEPVAYIRRTSGGTYISLTPISDKYGDKTDKTLPLYTAEQLHHMKWFVRSKEPETEDGDEHYLFLSGSNLDDLDYLEFDYAKVFGTKEEAELWKNPLTEAVQLPVEEE
ncbi:hypothetical protein [Leuconostoc falkenbergense]|uniref:hypothetical protein n=1 Tax=Leuconostoc falkenbergense TaxID=2766470 RepID=UPI0002738A9D|nr:hypothetical protein [Leuconostoc falkenbergense]OQJ68969.1 hypothetical protein BMS78_03400 [Leuconostoc pseudomesenteroides]CCJ66941.1 hypothetical protein Q5C_05970 [Leuconostoc pseudomesenteroides 4882]OQJ72466.1 hypothetical protein BMS79_02855 [Leuconostoc pseudomesenteroides]OQJ79869.1 hypothetical protein BMS81_05225 [Leuconostoc pseudomesenteroides]OQJ81479.1 hypothetical protein BMS84_07105 [Leuconostoc pseudomesenteroides]